MIDSIERETAPIGSLGDRIESVELPIDSIGDSLEPPRSSIGSPSSPIDSIGDSLEPPRSFLGSIGSIIERGNAFPGPRKSPLGRRTMGSAADPIDVADARTLIERWFSSGAAEC